MHEVAEVLKTCLGRSGSHTVWLRFWNQPSIRF